MFQPLKIEASSLDCGRDIYLMPPTVEDYFLARKAYPEQTEDSNTGYSFLEFATALAMCNADGSAIKDDKGLDAHKRFHPFSFADKYYLVQAFGAIAELDQDLQNTSEAHAQRIRNSNPVDSVYTILEDTLPCGSSPLTFYPLTGSIQYSASKAFTSPKVNGFTIEEFMFLYSLAQVDGQPVNDFNARLEAVKKLPRLDFRYASAVFFSLFSPVPQKLDEASALGKSARLSLFKAEIKKAAKVTA